MLVKDVNGIIMGRKLFCRRCSYSIDLIQEGFKDGQTEGTDRDGIRID